MNKVKKRLMVALTVVALTQGVQWASAADEMDMTNPNSFVIEQGGYLSDLGIMTLLIPEADGTISEHAKTLPYSYDIERPNREIIVRLSPTVEMLRQRTAEETADYTSRMMKVKELSPEQVKARQEFRRTHFDGVHQMLVEEIAGREYNSNIVATFKEDKVSTKKELAKDTYTYADSNKDTSDKAAVTDSKVDKTVAEALEDKANTKETKKDISVASLYRHPYPSDAYESYLENKMWGFKNGDKVAIKPQFAGVLTSFAEDRAFVKTKEGKKVAIDGTGKIIFEAPYDEVFSYKYGVAEVRRKVKSFGLGGFLSIVTSFVTGYADPYGNYDPVNRSIKRGYIDRYGKEVIDSKSDYVYGIDMPYGTGVDLKSQYGFARPDGTYVIPLSNNRLIGSDFRNGFFLFKNPETGMKGLMSFYDGATILKFAYEDIKLLSMDRVLLQQNGRKYLVDMINDKVLAQVPMSTTMDDYDINGYAVAHMDKGDIAYVDLDGHIVSVLPKASYSKLGEMLGHYQAVKAKGKWGVIDIETGKWVIEPLYKNLYLTH